MKTGLNSHDIYVKMHGTRHGMNLACVNAREWIFGLRSYYTQAHTHVLYHSCRLSSLTSESQNTNKLLSIKNNEFHSLSLVYIHICVREILFACYCLLRQNGPILFHSFSHAQHALIVCYRFSFYLAHIKTSLVSVCLSFSGEYVYEQWAMNIKAHLGLHISHSKYISLHRKYQNTMD